MAQRALSREFPECKSYSRNENHADQHRLQIVLLAGPDRFDLHQTDHSPATNAIHDRTGVLHRCGIRAAERPQLTLQIGRHSCLLYQLRAF